MFLAQLVPGVSFDIISYAASLTQIGFRSFIVASALGIVPQTLVYSFLGQRAPECVWAFLVLSGIVVGSAAIAIAIRRGKNTP